MAENPNQHLVGKESPPATIRVDRARIRQFARAVGLKDPVYYDEKAAKKAGHPSLIAPPTFAVALGVDDADPGGGEMPRPKWDVRKILHEGNEIVYVRLVERSEMFGHVRPPAARVHLAESLGSGGWDPLACSSRVSSTSRSGLSFTWRMNLPVPSNRPPGSAISAPRKNPTLT